MSTDSAAPVVEVQRVSRRFGDRDALSDVSLTVDRGEVVAVVGASGCGKSTLLELICGLQEPDSGSVRADRAVLMPQHDALFPWLDAAANAALPLRLNGVGSRDARRRAVILLDELGIGDHSSAHVWQLSGGMRQRVAMARTLLSGAPVLCLDEPFGALDAITRSGAQRWLAGVLAHESRTVVIVTHDVEEAALVADRVLVLSRRPGRVVAEFTVRAERSEQGRSPTDTAVVEVRAAALDALHGAAVA